MTQLQNPNLTPEAVERQRRLHLNCFAAAQLGLILARQALADFADYGVIDPPHTCRSGSQADCAGCAWDVRSDAVTDALALADHALRDLNGADERRGPAAAALEKWLEENWAPDAGRMATALLTLAREEDEPAAVQPAAAAPALPPPQRAWAWEPGA